MQRKTPYTGVNITVSARDELRRATVALTSDAGQRLSMSTVLVAAIRVAERHRDELLAELATDNRQPAEAA